MSAGRRVPLATARLLAEEVIGLLSATAARIEIAGSIRREAMTVGDIELVLIPKFDQVPSGLFGETTDVDLHYQRVQELLEQGLLTHRLDVNGRQACGRRYQRLSYEGLGLDLFCVHPPAQFGLIMAIRTGPAEFSKALVTKKFVGGLLPYGMQVTDGQIIDRGHPIETPEESDVFRVLGLDYIEPHDRTLRFAG